MSEKHLRIKGMSRLLFTIFIMIILIPLVITFGYIVFENITQSFDVVSKALIIEG